MRDYKGVWKAAGIGPTARHKPKKAKDMEKIQSTKTLVCVCHGKELRADAAALPQASIDALLQYGFQRFINDRANQGGREADTAFKHGVAEAVLAQLMEGWQGRVAAPKATLREGIAKDMLRKALGAKAYKALGEDPAKLALALARFGERFASQIDAEVTRREAMKREAQGMSLAELLGTEAGE